MLSEFSHVQLFVTPLTVACQAPLSTGLSRQEYWSGLPCPPYIYIYIYIYKIKVEKTFCRRNMTFY